ncbi:MAG TPA: hypothetical protein VLR90_08315 [Blastocatellia bacterium]|nr:hypothetical protein [Blastocatellia bacterium]
MRRQELKNILPDALLLSYRASAGRDLHSATLGYLVVPYAFAASTIFSRPVFFKQGTTSENKWRQD